MFVSYQDLSIWLIKFLSLNQYDALNIDKTDSHAWIVCYCIQGGRTYLLKANDFFICYSKLGFIIMTSLKKDEIKVMGTASSYQYLVFHE